MQKTAKKPKVKIIKKKQIVREVKEDGELGEMPEEEVHSIEIEEGSLPVMQQSGGRRFVSLENVAQSAPISRAGSRTESSEEKEVRYLPSAQQGNQKDAMRYSLPDDPKEQPKQKYDSPTAGTSEEMLRTARHIGHDASIINEHKQQENYQAGYQPKENKEKEERRKRQMF